MRLKTYRAGSIVQVMAQIRGDLGADALILSSRRISGGVEVTACLEPPEDDFPGLAPPPAAQISALQQTAPEGPGPEKPAPQTPAPQWLPAHPPAQPTAHPASDRAGLAQALTWHGIPAPIAARLSGQDLAHGLADGLQFGSLPIGPAPLLLAGPPGAGKTLTIARLATRLVLAGQVPLIISADGRRAGAAEELAAYTRLLGLELVIASKPATIARALARRAEGAPVLIDTSGINAFDPAPIANLAAITAAAAATPVLVLPAGLDAHEAAEHAEIFAAAGVTHFVPTRLDLARRLGAVISAAFAGRMILSEAGTGPGATDGLTRLTPALLATWLGRTPHFQTSKQAHHARPD